MVIVVMGVSGSGKTVVGSELAARLGWVFEDGDDFHPPANVEKMRRSIPLTDQDRIPWIRSLCRAVQEWVAQGRNVVLACSALRRWYRDALRDAVANHAWIRFAYLDGSYEEIDRRLRHRVGHFMPESLLRSQLARRDVGAGTFAPVGDRRSFTPCIHRAAMPGAPKARFTARATAVARSEQRSACRGSRAADRWQETNR